MITSKAKAIILVSSTAAVLFGAAAWLGVQVKKIETTRHHRSEIKTMIHTDIQARYNGSIRQAKLESHCGRAVYSLTIVDSENRKRIFYYDIDNGNSLNNDWLENCLLSSVQFLQRIEQNRLKVSF